MSYPPGPPDPDESRDPWATPSGEPAQPYGQPAYGQQQYGQQPYGQQPGGYGAPPPYARPTNGKAQAALWTGVGLLVTSCCTLGIFGFIPIVLGVMARREIRERQGQQGGEGLAMAGIVTGAIAILISLLAIAFIVLVIANGRSSFDSYSDTGV